MVDLSYRDGQWITREREAAERMSDELGKRFAAARAQCSAPARVYDPAAPSALVRQHFVPQGGRVRLSASVTQVGACPRCGTRLAHGCDHYPKEGDA